MIMDPENLNDWIRAGKIAAEVRDYGSSLIKKKSSYLEVTQKVEKKIQDLGALPAFPPQMALNEVAAHFTVDPEEDIVLENQLVSLDVGVMIEGAIGDTAVTVDLSGKYAELIKAAEAALRDATKVMDSGVFSLGKIGRMIEETIVSYGYKPIRNLSGHGLARFEIHKAPTIPNFDTGDKTEIQENSFFAIEPFASTGAGLIYETDRANIYSVVAKKPIRSIITREVFKEIEKYKGTPFTTRWLAAKFPLFKVNFALKELLQSKCIHAHPPLIDKDKGMVAQAEHTFYRNQEGKIIVITEKGDEREQ